MKKQNNNNFRNNKKAESARSMVEMLAVLALIGVLSIMGISGFSLAKNKYKASGLLNEANKRATLVAMQASQGREPLSIGEFTNNQDLNFSETVGHDTANKQFTLTIEHVAEAVCNQMQNIKGALIRKFEPDICTEDVSVILTYNDDLSEKETAGDYTFENCPNNFYQCETMHTCVASESDCEECPSNSSTTGTGTGTITGTGCKCDANYKTNADETACIPAGTQYMKGTVFDKHVSAVGEGCPEGFSWTTKAELESLSVAERAAIFSDSTICENCTTTIYWLQDNVNGIASFVTNDGALDTKQGNWYTAPALCTSVSWPACPTHSSTTGTGTGTIAGTNCKCNVHYKTNDSRTACIPPTTPYMKGIISGDHHSVADGCLEGFTWATKAELEALTLSGRAAIFSDPTICENCAGTLYWLQDESGGMAAFITNDGTVATKLWNYYNCPALCKKQ